MNDYSLQWADRDYLYYYLSKTKNDIISLCDPVNDEELIEVLKEECVQNSFKYINSLNTNCRCVKSCEEFIEKYSE